MLGFVKGLTTAVVKTAVGVPVTLTADLLTLGGTLTKKKGQSYTQDMFDSINEDLEEMTDD